MKLVFSTIPQAESAAMAKTLVTEGWVACVNIVPAVQSIYIWNDKLCDDTEALMMMKTTSAKAPELVQRILALHSYDVPEVVAVDIDPQCSSEDYLAWVRQSVQKK